MPKSRSKELVEQVLAYRDATPTHLNGCCDSRGDRQYVPLTLV